MSFDVPADAYGRFMGRFSEPLATQFAAYLRLAPGQRVLDVGCGPGALTAVLAAAARPGVGQRGRPVRIRSWRRCGTGCPAWTRGPARPRRSHGPTTASTALPRSSSCTSWPTRPRASPRWPGSPARAARSPRRSGTSRAAPRRCHRSGSGAQEVDPAAPGEADRPGSRDGELVALLRQAGLAEIESDRVHGDPHLRLVRAMVGPVHPRRRHGRRLPGHRRRRAARGHPRPPATASCRPRPSPCPSRSWAARAVVPG